MLNPIMFNLYNKSLDWCTNFLDKLFVATEVSLTNMLLPPKAQILASE